MGACVAAKKVNIKSQIQTGERIIKCNVEYGKESKKYTYSSQTNLKDVKQLLKRQVVKNVQENKVIKLYHNGKELNQENSALGNLVNGDEINLVMVCFTFTEDMLNDQKKVDEVLIKNLTPHCDIHKEEKATLVCINCSHSICQLCERFHLTHEIINKLEVLNYEENLRENFNLLTANFKELGIHSDIADFYKSFRQDLNKPTEDLVEMVEQIKKKQITIMNDFKLNFDGAIPPLMDYKDKLDELLKNVSDNKKELILTDDREFLEFFQKYRQTIDQFERNNENLNIIKNKLSKYNLLFQEFKLRTDEILKCVNEHYDVIKDYQLTDSQIYEDNININNLVSVGNNNKVNIKEGISLFNQVNNYQNSPMEMQFNSGTLSQSNKFNQSSKINLINLMTSPIKGGSILHNFDQLNSKDRKMKNVALAKQQLQEYNSKISDNMKSNSNIPLDFYNSDNLLNEVPHTHNQIINMEVSSRFLFIFDSQSKSLERKEIDLSNTLMKRFEAYHSTLNYKGKFYISGGYATTAKMFYEFTGEEFVRLKDMPNGHSYHCLLGVKNYIFAISGFNSKKVDKFSLDANSWGSLPDLSTSRSWPSCMCVDNSAIYVFGGVNKYDNKGNKVSERFDLRSNGNSWEVLEINFTEDFPYNFGIVNLPGDIVLFLGGKLNKLSENIDKCFSYNKADQSVSEIELPVLPYKDEFDGRLFLPLDEGSNKFGQFSAIFSNRLYIFDRCHNSFEVIECK